MVLLLACQVNLCNRGWSLTRLKDPSIPSFFLKLRASSLAGTSGQLLLFLSSSCHHVISIKHDQLMPSYQQEEMAKSCHKQLRLVVVIAISFALPSPFFHMPLLEAKSIFFKCYPYPADVPLGRSAVHNRQDPADRWLG